MPRRPHETRERARRFALAWAAAKKTGESFALVCQDFQISTREGRRLLEAAKRLPQSA